MEVYFDHAASTPTRPEVIEAMLPWLADHPGNPSGAHREAREARRVLDDARDAVAALVGADPGNVIFTSGGTESDNLAIDGILRSALGVAICPAAEHPAVLEPIRESNGVVAATDEMGRLDLSVFTETLQSLEDVTLVSAMTANNETGVINDIYAISEIVASHAAGALLHTDAVQAVAWLDLVEACRGADLVSLTGHKFGGPKGAGALVLCTEMVLMPVIRGGGQERERRGGTQNVAAIAGLGEAARLVMIEREETVKRVCQLRDRLEVGLIERLPETVCTVSAGVPRTPGITHLCWKGIESEALIFLLEQEGIFASAASSCASGAQEPSHVLAAMGVDREVARGSLRLSLGHTTTEADVERALTVIPIAVNQLQGLN